MKEIPMLKAHRFFRMALICGCAATLAAQPRPPAAPLYKLEDGLLQWPLSKADERFGAIDGRSLHQIVEDYTAIARRYRDAGHPQFWGRIMGTSADEESSRYLLDRFKDMGLDDVHLQSLDLPPQWMARSWVVTVGAPERSISLDSAHPIYATASTPAGGLEADAMWAGTGTAADYAGRNLQGMAVFLTRAAQTDIKMAQDRGAVAIFIVNSLPGNVRIQEYSFGTTIPTFMVGMDDGSSVRELMVRSSPNAVRVRVHLDAQLVRDLKTSTVWATLPGMTDETIYVLAHRDSWFEGGSDNASGVATMLGLAEYFSRVPRLQRRRTIVFLGAGGHHNSTEATGRATNPGNVSGNWLVANRERMFSKAALFINCEHTSTLQTFVQTALNRVRRVNTYTGMQWYAGGASRPQLQDLTVQAFRSFGVATYAEPQAAPPNGEAGGFWPYVPVLQASDYNIYMHSDGDTAAAVPWTGLESVTRAYAKVIEGVNRLDLEALKRPPDATANENR